MLPRDRAGLFGEQTLMLGEFFLLLDEQFLQLRDILFQVAGDGRAAVTQGNERAYRHRSAVIE